MTVRLLIRALALGLLVAPLACSGTSPQPASASIESTVGRPCEASTAMNINTPAENSQRVARLMDSAERG